MIKEVAWVEKYRPQTVAECILPVDLKDTFQKLVDQKNTPNLLLSGGAGMGKTTIAKAMLNELDCDYITINASKDGNIDTLRTDITNFATTMSFKGGRKYVILDEADYLTHHTQPALRNFMDTCSRNCGFILTCNYRNRLIEPLWSRSACIDFRIPKEEKPKIQVQFLRRVKDILTRENVEFEQEPLIAMINMFFPDFRRTLNELQKCAAKGKIDEKVLASLSPTSIATLVDFLKEKNFTKVRQWTAENLNNDSQMLLKTFYNEASNLFTPDYIPMLVITLGKYQYQAAFSLDHEINFSAAMAEIIVEASWK